MISRRTVVFITVGLFLSSSCIMGKTLVQPDNVQIKKNLNEIIPRQDDSSTHVIRTGREIIELIQNILAAPPGTQSNLFPQLENVLDNFVGTLNSFVQDRMKVINSMLQRISSWTSDDTDTFVAIVTETVTVFKAVISDFLDIYITSDGRLKNILAKFLQSVASLVLSSNSTLCAATRAVVDFPEEVFVAVASQQKALIDFVATFIRAPCTEVQCKNLNVYVSLYLPKLRQCF